jgi:hypothetical protein
MAIRGKFADGSELLAIPNYARTNRDRDLPPEAGPASGDPAFYMGAEAKPVGPPQPRKDGAGSPASIVWIREA